MLPANYATLKVVELKAELQTRGLSTKGNKADLVRRLTKAAAAVSPSHSESSEKKTTEVEVTPPPRDAPEKAVPVAQHVSMDDVQRTGDTDAIGMKETQISGGKQAEHAVESTSLNFAAPEVSAAQFDMNNRSDLPNDLSNPNTAVDIQKRKRRSSTPPPSAKRLRQDDDRLAEEQEDIVDFDTGDISGSPEEHHPQVAKDTHDFAKHAESDGEGNGPARLESESTRDSLPVDGEDVHLKRVAVAESFEAVSTTSSQAQDPSLDVSGEEAFRKRVAIGRHSETPSQSSQRPHLDQFETPQARKRESSEEGNGLPTPSSHPATSALYIRELMRPLRVETIEQHIIDLSTIPGSEPGPSPIQNFYLDQIRTHAFVNFDSISTAKRVRAALHDQVWPNERNRKRLWVDFFPPELMKKWIDREETEERGNARRWEVVYVRDDGGVVALHREVGPDTKPFPNSPAAGPSVDSAGPVYPGIEAAPRGPRGRAVPRRPNHPQTSQTLALPPLSYQPLSEDIARRRIDNMRSYYMESPPSDLGKDYNRYTFESVESFVDRGTEVFIGIRPPHREKEHQERLRAQRMGTAGAGSAADAQSHREDYRPPTRPPMSDPDRFSRPRYEDSRRFGGDRRSRNRGFRADRGPSHFRGEDPYRYRPGY